MSNTFKEKLKNRKKKLANTYGLCGCSQCRRGRSKNAVKKIARGFSLFFRGKSNRDPNKGIYTD